MLGFFQRVAPTLVQHTTSGIQTLDEYVTTTGSPIIDEVLSGIAPPLVTLPFMSMEG